MYGPAVRCKRILPMWRMCGLASMYPAFDWSLLCSGAIMDISARAISLADRPQRAKRVTSVDSGATIVGAGNEQFWTFATWGNSGIVPHEGTGNQLSRNA